jgi:hypothetical protein
MPAVSMPQCAHAIGLDGLAGAAALRRRLIEQRQHCALFVDAGMIVMGGERGRGGKREQGRGQAQGFHGRSSIM